MDRAERVLRNPFCNFADKLPAGWEEMFQQNFENTLRRVSLLEQERIFTQYDPVYNVVVACLKLY